MNITNVSFAGNTKNPYGRYSSSRMSGNQFARQAATERETLRNASPLNGDEFKPSKEQNKTTTPNRHKKLNPWKAACITLGLAHVLNFGYNLTTAPKDIVTVDVPSNASVSEYAEMYGVDDDIIKEVNNLDDDNLYGHPSIEIPQEFDLLGDEITKLQEKLFKPNTSPEDLSIIQQQLQILLKQQDMQQQLAMSYTDGDFVYYKLTLPCDGTQTPIQAQYQDGINVETFKDIFGIQDGVIRNWNDIDYTWASDSDTGGYQDYTSAKLYNGQTIQVPVRAVNAKHIVFVYD